MGFLLYKLMFDRVERFTCIIIDIQGFPLSIQVSPKGVLPVQK
jgi:hypothetical protein